MDFPQRKTLPHEVPLWIDPQKEIYFLTVNCRPKGTNHLARPDIAGPLLESVRFRNERFIWFAHLFLIMPDHIHTLISFPPQEHPAGTAGPAVRGADMSATCPYPNQVGMPRRGVPARVERVERTLQETVSSWKRWTAGQLNIAWQRDFFEHRLRSEESRQEKANYILANPVRKGLVKEPNQWPYVFIPKPIR